MKQVTEMDWTDGVAKSLRSLATQIEKVERSRHTPEENYYSDPNVIVTDITTGSTVILQTEEHKGGKTHGRGYRRCSAVEQRIPSKLPQKKIIKRLLKIAIRNFVPADASPDEYSVVVKKAINDIAKMIVSDEEDDNKHDAALQAALSDLMDMTVSKRAGDSLLKVEAIPLLNAIMDVSAIKEEVEMMKVMKE